MLLAIAVLVEFVRAQEKADNSIYEGLNSFGMGFGTLMVFITLIIGIILCSIKNAFVLPNCCVCLGITLPVLTFVVAYLWPKESLATDTTKTDKIPTDNFMVKSTFFLILIFINLAITLLALHLLKNETIMVRRADS